MRLRSSYHPPPMDALERTLVEIAVRRVLVLFLPSTRLPKLEMVVGRTIEPLADGSRSLVEKVRAQHADLERIDADRPAVA